jgi:hypothetical protein
MIMRSEPWNSQTAVSKWAHLLERSGLALAGAACGLFVAAELVRADVDFFGSGAPILAMMLFGAAGFYLGIDLPARAPHRVELPLRSKVVSRADAVELLSAAGTFLAAATAVWSVAVIILDDAPAPGGVLLTGGSWAIGAAMQIAAGVIARQQSNDPSNS